MLRGAMVLVDTVATAVMVMRCDAMRCDAMAVCDGDEVGVDGDEAGVDGDEAGGAHCRGGAMR